MYSALNTTFSKAPESLIERAKWLFSSPKANHKSIPAKASAEDIKKLNKAIIPPKQ